MKKLLLALIMAGALAFGQGVVSPRMLKQGGAASGQCLQWDGSKWAPAACTTSAGSGTEYQYNNSGSLAAGLQWHCPSNIVGFGGCTASFPALKRSGTSLEVRLADDSADTLLKASVFNASTGFQVSGAATTGNFLRGNGTYFVASAIQAGDVPDLSATYQTVSEKGAANGYASLNASSLVVQNPANATTTPTASKIPIADASGDLDDGWFPSTITRDTEIIKGVGSLTTTNAIPKVTTSGTLGEGLLRDNGTLIGFGGLTSSYPALKRSGTGLEVRLANDSTDGYLKASVLNATTGFQVNGGATTGHFLRGDGTNFVSSAIQASDLQGLNYTWTGTHDFSGATLEIPNSTSLPGTCAVGEVYVDSDASAGQRLYLCESADTWVLQTQSVYNVKAFGAVGDGTTDDTAAIFSAISAAGSGDTIYFPPGTYLTSGFSVTDKALRLVGAGVEASIIKGSEATGQVFLSNGTNIRSEIRDLTIDAGGSGMHGMVLNGFGYGLIQNVRVVDACDGIALGAGSGYSTIKKVLIQDSSCYGVYITGDSTGEVTLEDVRIKSENAATTTTAGIYIDKTTVVDLGGFYLRGVHVLGVTGTWTYGLYYNSSVAGNYGFLFVDNSNFELLPFPIYIKNVDRGYIEGSWINSSGSGNDAITLDGSDLFVIANNLFQGIGANGIALLNGAQRATIIGNDMSGIGGTTFRLDTVTPPVNLSFGLNRFGSGSLTNDVSTLNSAMEPVKISSLEVSGGDFLVQSTAPSVDVNETDAGTDEKYWRIYANGGKFYVQTANDAYTAFANAMYFDRSGNSATELRIMTGPSNSDAVRISSYGLKIYDMGTKPACNSTTRGQIWRDEGGAGVADKLEVCAKNSSDSYAWYPLASIP